MRTTSSLLGQLAAAVPNTNADPQDSVLAVSPLVLNTVEVPFPHIISGSSGAPVTLSSSGFGFDRRTFVANGSFIAVTLNPGLWKVKIHHTVIQNGSNFNVAIARAFIRGLGVSVFAAEINCIACNTAAIAFTGEFIFTVTKGNTLEIMQQIENANAAATQSTALYVCASRLL